MAIDFNKQLVFDPKIEIVGEEVPLAAMEKTGAVLQDRYDKAYEQYSIADEALKQMEASANAVDREKAKELRGLYNQEMQTILGKGDFHNMRHQVSGLARNAAANYKTIAERNQKIQADLDALAKDPRYRLDPEGAKKEYLSKIGAVNINPETRTISDFTVTPYNAAADFETADKLLQIAPTLRAKLLKAKGSYFGTRTLPTGEKVNTVETQGGGYRILDNKEIENELKSYIITDPAFQAYIKRDVGRMGLDPNSEEGKVAYNQLVQERTADTSKALGKMYEIDENMNQNTFTVLKSEDDGSGNGRKRKSLDSLLVTNTETSGEEPLDMSRGKLRSNAPQDLIQRGVLGNISGVGNLNEKEQKVWYNELLDAMDYNIDNSTNLKDKQRFSEAKQMFKEYKQLVKDFPEYKRTLSEIATREPGYALKNIFDKTLAGVENITSLFSDPAKRKEFQQRLYNLDSKYRNYIGKGFSDTDIEQGVENYLKVPKQPLSTSIPMLAPGIKDEELQKAFNYMGNVFNNSNTEIYKQSEGFDFEKPFEFRKVATAPRGNGTGILFEVQQKDGNGKIQTALVEPNYKGDYSILQNIEDAVYQSTGKEIDLVNSDKFKNVSPFKKVGQKRTLQDIYEEAELGQVNPKFADIQIEKVKNGYKVVGSNTIFNSYIEAISALLQ